MQTKLVFSFGFPDYLDALFVLIASMEYRSSARRLVHGCICPYYCPLRTLRLVVLFHMTRQRVKTITTTDDLLAPRVHERVIIDVTV